jgi:hypothetical protein
MALPFEVTGAGGRPALLMEPHGVDSHPNALAMRGTELVVPSGARIINTDPAAAIDRYEFEFRARDRDEVAFLEAFFDARRGKHEGFWLPTTQWEFDLYGFNQPNFGSYFLNVQHTDYAENVFPLGPAFRRIAITRGDTWSLFTIDAATPHSPSAGFDLLHMTNDNHSGPDVPGYAVSVNVPRNDSYRTLWLRYVRFDQDELVAEVMNGEGACRIQLAMVELPREVPA